MNILFLLKAQIVKEIILARRYLFEATASMIMLYITFMGIYFAVRKLAIGGTDINIASYQLVGFLLWIFALTLIGIFADDISGSAVVGVLEQLFLTPTGILRYLICMAIGRTLLQSIPIAILLVIVLFTTGIRLILDPTAIITILLLTIIGFYGLGLLFGGLALLYKRIGPVTAMVRGALLFASGALIPIDKFPPPLQIVCKLFPMTQGLIMLRKVTVNGDSLWALIQNGDMLILIVNSLIYLVLGLATFKFMENLSRNKGVIGAY